MIKRKEKLLISKETHNRFECDNCGSPQGNCILFLQKNCRNPEICIYTTYIKANWKNVNK